MFYAITAGLPSLSSSDLPGSFILIGAIILVVSSGITAYANILMKLDALQLRDDWHPRFIMARRFVLMAVALYVIGGMADMVSLGLVPLSLRACASCLTIPFNALFARMTLGEQMTQMQVIGSIVTVFSCMVAMLIASDQGGDTRGPADQLLTFTIPSPQDDIISKLLSERVAIFTLYTLPPIILCWMVIWKNLPWMGSHISVPAYTSALHRLTVLASATMATSYQTAWTNLFIKCVAVIAQETTFLNGVLWILFGAMILSALCQMMLMSAIMRLFEAVVVVPPYQIAITVWLIVFSSVFFDERVDNIIGFVISLLVSFGGILMVALPNRRRNTVDEPLVQRISNGNLIA